MKSLESKKVPGGTPWVGLDETLAIWKGSLENLVGGFRWDPWNMKGFLGVPCGWVWMKPLRYEKVFWRILWVDLDETLGIWKGFWENLVGGFRWDPWNMKGFLGVPCGWVWMKPLRYEKVLGRTLWVGLDETLTIWKASLENLVGGFRWHHWNIKRFIVGPPGWVWIKPLGDEKVLGRTLWVCLDQTLGIWKGSWEKIVG